METIKNYVKKGKFLTIALFFFVLCRGSVFAQPDVISYNPRGWIQYSKEHPACTYYDQGTPDSGLFNAMYFDGDLPTFGYPYHMGLVAGFNDTLNVNVQLFHLPFENYVLAGKEVESWFAPQVYQLWVMDSSGPSLRDSTQLGYRFRGWYQYDTLRPPLDTLKPEDIMPTIFKLDIWNLPQGRFQLCIFPTDKIPEDMTPIISGYVFEYYPPQSLADTINAWEVCFWRSFEDTNFAAVEQWVDKILDVNPTSVPGWWLKATYYHAIKDTTNEKEAYTLALKYLNYDEDPLMPDSTERLLRSGERLYLEWIRTMLEWNRSRFGP